MRVAGIQGYGVGSKKWILGACEQNGVLDKKGRQPDRSPLGEGTFGQRNKQDEVTKDWEMR